MVAQVLLFIGLALIVAVNLMLDTVIENSADNIKLIDIVLGLCTFIISTLVQMELWYLVGIIFGIALGRLIHLSIKAYNICYR